MNDTERAKEIRSFLQDSAPELMNYLCMNSKEYRKYIDSLILLPNGNIVTESHKVIGSYHAHMVHVSTIQGNDDWTETVEHITGEDMTVKYNVGIKEYIRIGTECGWLTLQENGDVRELNPFEGYTKEHRYLNDKALDARELFQTALDPHIVECSELNDPYVNDLIP